MLNLNFFPNQKYLTNLLSIKNYKTIFSKIENLDILLFKLNKIELVSIEKELERKEFCVHNFKL
jgi:hypothetical protein